MRICLRPMMIVAMLLGVGALEIAATRTAVAQTPMKRVRPSAFVSAEFCAALVIHPQQIAKSSLLADLPFDALAGAAGARAGMPIEPLQKLLQPEKISRVIVMVDAFPGGNVAALPVIVVQYSEDVDGDALFKHFFPGASSETHNGKTYLKGGPLPLPGDLPLALSMHIADRRTVVVGLEPTLKKALEASPTDNPLLEQLRKTSLDHDILIASVTGPMVKSFERNTGVPIDEASAELPEIMVQAKDVKSTAVMINLSGETLLKLTIDATTPEATAKFVAMAESHHDEAKKQYEANKAGLTAGLPPEIAVPLDALAQEVLRDVVITSSGTQAVVELKTPKKLAAVVAAAFKMLPMMLPGGPGGPGGFPGGPGGPAGGFPGGLPEGFDPSDFDDPDSGSE